MRETVYLITQSNRVCETPSMMVQLRHNPVHLHPFKQQKEMLVSFYTLHDIFLNFFYHLIITMSLPIAKGSFKLR